MAAVDGWIGVDFDRTLATYDGHWRGGSLAHHRPVKSMVERIWRWLDDGIEVRIVTARVAELDPGQAAEQRKLIVEWLKEHVGIALDVQCGKDRGMLELWDDSAVTVERNTGRRLSPSAVEHDVSIAPKLQQAESIVEIIMRQRPEMSRVEAEMLLRSYFEAR